MQEHREGQKVVVFWPWVRPPMRWKSGWIICRKGRSTQVVWTGETAPAYGQKPAGHPLLDCESRLRDFYRSGMAVATNPFGNDYYYDRWFVQVSCFQRPLSVPTEWNRRTKSMDRCTGYHPDRWRFSWCRYRLDIYWTESEWTDQTPFNEYSIILTQGFIGATDENGATTGREGSVIPRPLAHMLDAESQTIWKMWNRDECRSQAISDAVPLPELNYNEVLKWHIMEHRSFTQDDQTTPE